MKIGFAINPLLAAENRWGDKRYECLSRLGFDAIDFQMADTDLPIYAMSDQELSELTAREKQLASDAGVTIFQAHGPWRWPPRDLTDEDRAERMEKMKHSIYISHLLGCKNWIVHPIMPFGIEDLDTENAPKTWEMNVAFMSELLETAKKYDVTICLENMPMVNFSIATPERILEFAELMNDEHFKVCLDTGHVAVFKELSLGDEVRRLGKHIVTFHIHDNDGRRDLHQFPGFGRIDWSDFGRALRDIGYDGSFSLETAPPTALSTRVYEKYLTALIATAEDIINS